MLRCLVKYDIPEEETSLASSRGNLERFDGQMEYLAEVGLLAPLWKGNYVLRPGKRNTIGPNTEASRGQECGDLRAEDEDERVGSQKEEGSDYGEVILKESKGLRMDRTLAGPSHDPK